MMCGVPFRMRLIVISLAAFLTGQAVHPSVADEFRLRVVFTNPVCSQDNHRPKNVYCSTANDWKATHESNLELSRLLEDFLIHPDVTRIDGSSFYLKDSFIDTLYRAYEKSAPVIAITSDIKSIERVRKRFVLEGVSKVDLAHSLQLFDGTALANADGYKGRSSFHIKSLLIQYRNGEEFGLVFTSGNFRLSTKYMSGNVEDGNLNTANFENYNFLRSAPSDPAIKQHQCLYDALHRRRDFDDEYQRRFFAIDIERCLHFRRVRPSMKDRLTLLSLPAQARDALAYLALHAGWADKIDIASYNANSSCIKTILKAAIDRGVKVRVVTDDDMCVKERQRKWYIDLVESGAEVRFMRTNGSEGDLRNRFHHKFFIFSKANKRVVLTGSTNLTCGGFSANYENAYFINEPSATAEYATEFSRYWDDLSSPKDAINQCDQ